MEIKGAQAGAALVEEADAFNFAGNFAEAEPRYDQLLTQNHDQPDLLATIGTMYLRSERIGLAIVLLARAVALKPQSDFMSNLAIAYKYAGQYAKALYWLGEAVKIDPSAESLAAYSAMFINVGTPELALKASSRAIKIDQNHTMAHWNRAMAMLEMGNWEEGWDEHEWGFQAKMRIRREIARAPYWDGTEGKTIAVYGEQGLGDEIMFASMLPDLMSKNDVILECHPRLKTLFQRAFPTIPIYGTRDQKEIAWPNNHDIDYTVSIGSLGKWFRRSRSAFPGTAYLKAEALPNGARFRVGISWTGGQKQGRIRTRAIPLAWWKSILNVRDVEFVSLQYTDADAEIDAVNAAGYNILKTREAKTHDYYETARLVASCDLVISCCTSVVHLSGALGVPCWVMVPNKPAWRYGVTGGMPWYRSVRLYRQPKGDAESWMPVVQRVGFDLEELVDGQKEMVA